MALAALRAGFRPMAMATPFQRVTSAAPSVAQMPGNLPAALKPRPTVVRSQLQSTLQLLA